ncbi:MAG TPA: hypothetical protein V6C85_16390 [Allocoleopsis sp.]
MLDRYQLPPELEVESLYLHPLALMEKWGLDLETTARETGVDVGTLTRYRYPDYASTKRRPYRNKSVLRVAAVLDQLWSVTGCPYRGTLLRQGSATRLN